MRQGRQLTEAQRGSGRTDLLLTRNDDAHVMVGEVKIWGATIDFIGGEDR